MNLDKHRDTVSVVIPTMGRKTVLKAVESALSQTYTPLEILVVVDNPDAVGNIGRWLAHSGVHIIETAGRTGGSAARNLGADHAAGKWVAFLDDDDWWEPTKLERQLLAVTESGYDFSYTWTYFHDGASVRLLPRYHFDGSQTIASYLVSRSRLRHGDGYIQSSSILVSQNVATTVRWNESLPKHQDWDFVVRVMEAVDNKSAVCEEPLVHVRKDSAGSVSKVNAWRSSERWLADHQDKLSSRAYGDFVSTQIIRSSLAAGDRKGFARGVKLLRRGVPHASALIVGLAGALSYIQSRLRR